MAQQNGTHLDELEDGPQKEPHLSPGQGQPSPATLVQSPSQFKSILKSFKDGEAKSPDYKRNVSWQDFHGKELVVTHEYEPSDSDDEDDPHGGSGGQQACCTIS
uniref:Uncharacterized protein n=1 Tax=Chlamydomonas leiostraca TaxID=1034604 RepID=A0A7S0R6S9_9CHLO|mmetsp:Transcript_15323/g.38182  ORF Transcript_15323/g.38182 Transcript_15323/m.38182 type:complete len:104 (+) Transcript_15323:143-454(+)